MARIAGINIPVNKHIWVGLTHIYGIGRTRALSACKAANVAPSTRVRDLTEPKVNALRAQISRYMVQVVDLMTGEHMKPAFGEINPSRLVPVLEDGDFRLTESSAILKYLADKIDSPAYPKDLRKRARVNEMMDWLNTGFDRDFGYGLVYPQLFPHHKRRSDEAHAGAIARGKEKTKFWFGVLDQHLEIRPVIREEAHSDRAADEELAGFVRHGLAQPVEEVPGGVDRLLARGEIHDREQELVAGQARDDARRLLAAARNMLIRKG